MRTLMTALGLGGAAVVLQGCGSGGGGDKPHSDTCLNNAIDLVTQSSTGGSITGSVTAMDIPVTMKMDTVQKVDLDKFNLRMDIKNGAVSITQSGQTGTMNVNIQVIFNAANKEVVAKYDIEPADPSTGWPTMKNCSKITSDKIPDPSTISSLFKTYIKPLLVTLSKCGGNDGTDDSWKIDFDSAHPTPGMPIPPLPAGDSVKLNSVMKMNKDYLISEVDENLQASGTVQGKKGTVTADITAKYTGSSATGPTDSDLDYSSWGTCYPMTPPGNTVDTIFQPQDNAAVTVAIDKIVFESAFRKMFLASMLSEPKSEDKQVVV